MTTRESLHQLLDELTDDEVEALARIAREHGLPPPPGAGEEAPRCIDARQYPVLAAVWNNDDDAIFDSL
ncbi:MAG: hypothetical protein L6Q80_08100 [Dehalococcoidia bacterium]|nr:hypothetical protein [Dehalococcoidia bacterium]